MTTNPIPLVETPVQALLARYQSDPTFKAALDAAGSTTAAVQVATQYGLTVSINELQALRPASADVSDAALENVAGGAGFTSI